MSLLARRDQEVRLLHTHPDHIGRGAGTLLIEAAKKSSATHWILGGSVHRAGRKSTTVDEFLRAMAGDQARRWGMAAIVLLLPAVLLMALETNSFWVAGGLPAS